ncbi:hypothetical protein GYMLUDRAFT_236213 [Collybiopsis luxurians FD-317 M1]|nr:hypothetical protein GYMLUDRAFT_236213 [Collybiopsis luxurians FD-317 M1]
MARSRKSTKIDKPKNSTETVKTKNSKAKGSTKMSKDAAYYARAQHCAEARVYIQIKRASNSSKSKSSKQRTPATTPDSQPNDADPATLISLYHVFIVCCNDFDTWLDSSVPQDGDGYFRIWEQFGARVSTRLYQLMDHRIPDSTHCREIYKAVCAMQIHLGRCRAEHFFSVDSRHLKQSIVHPSWD